MHEQLEFQFWESSSNEGVKPRACEEITAHNLAEDRGDLTKLENQSLLEEILDMGNIAEACRKVISNKGAAGIDGVSVKELNQYMSEHWSSIALRIRERRYRPSAVRRVEIPKPNGGKRLLGIPTVIDRVIQQAILQRLTPIFDPTFSESSFGFRPKRSAHDAVRQARSFQENGYKIVVDIDLEKFFDRVNHDMLMARVARRVKDKDVLYLIRQYLNSGVMLNGVCIASEEGVPQGGPLSPLLANILLDDLDKELEKRGHKFCRYADDCNVYVKGIRSGYRVKESLTKYLREKLKLTVNEEKSAVDIPARRKFLGFSFTRLGENVKISISRQAIDKLKDRIRFFTRPHWSITLDERLKRMNSYLTGWLGYFALTDDPSILGVITGWMRRRMRLVVWQQWKKPSARYRNLKKLGLSERNARRAAHNSSGAWRNSRSPMMNMGLTNEFWRKLGLVNLSILHMTFRRG